MFPISISMEYSLDQQAEIEDPGPLFFLTFVTSLQLTETASFLRVVLNQLAVTFNPCLQHCEQCFYWVLVRG